MGINPLWMYLVFGASYKRVSISRIKDYVKRICGGSEVQIPDFRA